MALAWPLFFVVVANQLLVGLIAAGGASLAAMLRCCCCYSAPGWSDGYGWGELGRYAPLLLLLISSWLDRWVRVRLAWRLFLVVVIVIQLLLAAAWNEGKQQRDNQLSVTKCSHALRRHFEVSFPPARTGQDVAHIVQRSFSVFLDQCNICKTKHYCICCGRPWNRRSGLLR